MPRGLTAGQSVRDLARLATAGVVGVCLVGALATVRIWQQGNRDEQRPADAIVVLGAAQYNGRPSPVFQARLDHAIALWYAGLAPWFIVTGGGAEGDRTTEAAVARQYALDHGVPADAMIGEDEGRNTLSSLEAVAALLRERGLESAVFVSDPTHMLRVIRISEDLGIRAWGSPTTTSPISRDVGRTVRATAHELGALGVYFMVGGAPPEDAAGE